MHFSINRSIFQKNLTDVQRAVTSKTTIPILTGIKLVLSDNELILTGSDSNISIERIISKNNTMNDLTILKTGQIVLPSRFFGEIIRKLSEDQVTIKLLDNNQVEISSGKSIFTINGIEADLYPKIEIIEQNQTNTIKLPSVLFKTILSQTLIATSTNENKPILTGIHFIIENQKLIAIATDSHRMNRRIIDLPDVDKTMNYKCTVPAKSLTELTRILNDTDEITIVFDETKILFHANNLYFYSRLLEGIYPEISRLIRDDFNTKIKLNASTFLGSVERASILSTEGKNDIVTLNIKDLVLISSESSEIGFVEEEVTIKENIGENLTISFNPLYMKDALKVLNHQDIEINFLGEGKPFTLKNENDDKNIFVQVITPIRTRK